MVTHGLARCVRKWRPASAASLHLAYEQVAISIEESWSSSLYQESDECISDQWGTGVLETKTVSYLAFRVPGDFHGNAVCVANPNELPEEVGRANKPNVTWNGTGNSLIHFNFLFDDAPDTRKGVGPGSKQGRECDHRWKPSFTKGISRRLTVPTVKLIRGSPCLTSLSFRFRRCLLLTRLTDD
jgi:hypothetical protein